MDKSLKKMGDGWIFVPEDERKKKLNYDKLLYRINQREKRIEKLVDSISELKKELKEWKKFSTSEYKELVKFHKIFQPSFSVSLSKTPKVKQNSFGSFQTGGNKSWTIFVTVGKITKTVYLGTIKSVNEQLDLIEGKSEYFEMFPHKSIPHKNKIKSKISELVIPLIRNELVEMLQKEGSVETFLNSPIKGSDYLDLLYKNSKYYKVKEEGRTEKKKGKFITYNEAFISKKK
ncbi:hypothetical protein ACRZ9O_10440 [Aquirufa sp. HETE-40SA]